MENHQRQFQLMAPFLEATAQLGIEPEQLFSSFQERRDARAPEEDSGRMDFVQMLETAAELAGDPGFAIRIGQNLNLVETGSFGFALMNCATIRDSFELILRYQKLVAPGPHWNAFPHADGIMVRIDLKRGSAEQQRMAIELAVSINLNHARLLSNDPMLDIGFEVNYPRPRHLGTYLESLSVPVVYDSEYTQTFMPERVLSTPMNSAESALKILYLQQCEEILSSMEAAESTTAEVRQLLVESTNGFPDVATVAERMNLSERTLRRRLQAESTGFRGVLEDVKSVLARRYLAETVLEVVDIANLLGYSEPENFYRAFARWNRVTPAEYRLQHG